MGNPFLMVADVGDQIMLPGGGESMWTTITTGVGHVITDIMTPVLDFVTKQEICLAFLAVTFTSLGIRLGRRAIGALGRGR